MNIRITVYFRCVGADVKALVKLAILLGITNFTIRSYSHKRNESEFQYLNISYPVWFPCVIFNAKNTNAYLCIKPKQFRLNFVRVFSIRIHAANGKATAKKAIDTLQEGSYK